VPLPAADGDLVIHRSLTPSAVTTALGVKDLADVPAAIAAQQVAESRQRASTRSEPALTRENSPMTRGRPLCYNGIAAPSSARHGASSPEPADQRRSITVVTLAWLRGYMGRGTVSCHPVAWSAGVWGGEGPRPCAGQSP
jgi:hypothetical protein